MQRRGKMKTSVYQLYDTDIINLCRHRIAAIYRNYGFFRGRYVTED